MGKLDLNPQCYNILPKCSNLRKIEYAKKKESVTHSQKKKQATETASERTNMLDLTKKIFK